MSTSTKHHRITPVRESLLARGRQVCGLPKPCAGFWIKSVVAPDPQRKK